MSKEQLLQQVKNTVQFLLPDAEVILYGSRARGDAVVDSDWDFLILTRQILNEDRKKEIRRQLYEIEWKTGEILSVAIENNEDWNRPLSQITPFYQNVVREGIPL